MEHALAAWRWLIAFADAHPLLTWIVTTAILNALVRAWPRLQGTPLGRAFAWLCGCIGVDALGALKFSAASAGARALGLAASAAGTTPEALQGQAGGATGAPAPAPSPGLSAPEPPPPDAPPTAGGNARRL